MKIWQSYKSFAGGPVGLISAGLILTTGVLLGWRWGVSPILKRRKREQAEEFAEFIFQEHQKKIGDKIQQ